MTKTAWVAILTSISVAALAVLFALHRGADDLTARVATAEHSGVAVSAATATPTITPVLIPPAISVPLHKGWNCYCYRDIDKPVEAVADDISGPVQAMYRIAPGGPFERWVPDAPEASTIASIASNDGLFILMAEEGFLGQVLAGPYPSSATLVAGWNSVCYTGSGRALEDATAGIAGDIGIVYQLAPDQTWGRFVPNRPEVSNLQTFSSSSPLIILVTTEGGVEWEFQR